MKKQTPKEFEQKINNVWNGEFIVLDNYIDGHTKIRFKHKCGWIFLADPYNVLNHSCVCPVCDSGSRSIDSASYNEKVRRKYGDEYTLLSEYLGMSKPIQIRHNRCTCSNGFHDFSLKARDVLERTTVLCDYENPTHLTIDTIKQRLNGFHPNYKLLSEKYVYQQKLSVQCDRGHIYEVVADTITAGGGCPYCANQKTLKGFNDLWTTHPQYAKNLLNPDEGYTFNYFTKHNKKFKCPSCGNIIEKFPSEAFSDSGRLICKCKDGISYPEKLFAAILNDLGISYISQLDKKTFQWCDKYRYDFYIKKDNTIVEIHGMQHYDTNLSWCNYKSKNQPAIDSIKEELARINGINYIVIDARYSDLNWIKEHICNSQLSSLLPLELVDWEKCNEIALQSKCTEAIKLWNTYIYSISEIAKIINVTNSTVLDYLEKGNQSNLCAFNREQYRKDVNRGLRRIPVKCVETQKIYRCFADVKKELGIDLTRNKIKKYKTVGGFHWELTG